MRARFAVSSILALLLAGATGGCITTKEPFYGNYDRSEASPLQRRSDIRACEQRHYRSAGGPGTRKAAFTQLRVEQCLESLGYQRQAPGR